MATKLEVYEAALEKIRDMNPITLKACEIAGDALEQFIVDREADRLAKTNEIKDFMLSKGLVFASAQELSDALNEGKIVTTRGKTWTKSTATRVLAEVRPMIEADLRAKTGAVDGVSNVKAPVEAVIAPKPVAQPVIEEVKQAVYVEPVSVAASVAQSELDELDNLLEDLPLAG